MISPSISLGKEQNEILKEYAEIIFNSGYCNEVHSIVENLILGGHVYYFFSIISGDAEDKNCNILLFDERVQNIEWFNIMKRPFKDRIFILLGSHCLLSRGQILELLPMMKKFP